MGFNYPASCETMKTPKKTGETKMGMFAIGGIILAAGLGGAYWLAQR